MAENGGKPYIQSIRRAVAILRSFTEAEPELGVNELSRRLDLHKSTVSRMLATLQHEGLISQNSQTGKYRVGLGLVSLAGVALGRLDVRGAAMPYLGDLVELSQETVNVAVRDGSECVSIARVASPKPLRYVGWIGRRTPLHCTASGKVILAHLSVEERGQWLSERMTQYTSKTVIDREVLEATLPDICRQGYAIVHEEFEEGFSALAAPVYNHIGAAVGTVSISGPSFRLAPGEIEKLIEPILETTRKVSGELGYLYFEN